MKDKYQKQRIHKSGADERQGSALQKSRFEWHMRIVENYTVWNVKFVLKDKNAINNCIFEEIKPGHVTKI